MIENSLDIKKKLIMIIVAASLLVGAVVIGIKGVTQKDNTLTLVEDGHKTQDSGKLATESKMEGESANAILYVHVTGAVSKPNLYRLPEGARVYDAIMIAKPTKDADLDQVNLAEAIRDQMKIIVPKKGAVIVNDIQSNSHNALNSSMESGNQIKINLNTATENQIEELQGIGPALAKKIIEYRQTKGGFHSIDDLKNVSGIGEKKFAQLKGQVSI